MLDNIYKYNYDGIYADTKKGLLKKVLEKYSIRDKEYMIFYIWSNRLKDTLSFEEKLDLYVRYKTIEREIYDNKKDKFKNRSKDI